MVVVIDNYDSFTYNLVQYLGELGAEVKVVRNDRQEVDEIVSWNPEGVVISPGPGTPADAGISNEILRRLAGKAPILGVCLGHQCIGEVFGGKVGRAPYPVHGKTAKIFHTGKDLFAGLPNPLTAVRYHSLIIKEENFPAELEVTARTEDGLVMGIRHRLYPLWGVQFHPESVLTEGGKALMANFLHTCRDCLRRERRDEDERDHRKTD